MKSKFCVGCIVFVMLSDTVARNDGAKWSQDTKFTPPLYLQLMASLGVSLLFISFFCTVARMRHHVNRFHFMIPLLFSGTMLTFSRKFPIPLPSLPRVMSVVTIVRGVRLFVETRNNSNTSSTKHWLYSIGIICISSFFHMLASEAVLELIPWHMDSMSSTFILMSTFGDFLLWPLLFYDSPTTVLRIAAGPVETTLSVMFLNVCWRSLRVMSIGLGLGVSGNGNVLFFPGEVHALMVVMLFEITRTNVNDMQSKKW
eukprot:PhF_6_TR2745/c0_g1_i1/m.4448